MSKTYRMILALAIVGLLASITGRAEAATARENQALAAVRASISAGNAKFLKALEAGDAKAFAALFAPDAIELPSEGGEATRGRAAIQADEAAGAKAEKITGGTIRTTNIYVDGAEAFETGIYSFQIAEPGKPLRTTLGRYFEVWQKQPDGSWLIRVDCGFPDKYKR